MMLLKYVKDVTSSAAILERGSNSSRANCVRGSEPSKEEWLSNGSLNGFAGIGVCVGVGVSVEEPVLVLRNTLRLVALRPSINYTDVINIFFN